MNVLVNKLKKNDKKGANDNEPDWVKPGSEMGYYLHPEQLRAQGLSSPRSRDCFSKVSQLFGPISRATIPFTSSQRRGSKPSNSANPLVFSGIENTLKDQLFETSGPQFDNWLFGPEKFSGLSGNGPQSQKLERWKTLGTRLHTEAR